MGSLTVLPYISLCSKQNSSARSGTRLSMHFFTRHQTSNMLITANAIHLGVWAKAVTNTSTASLIKVMRSLQATYGSTFSHAGENHP